ncbi:hypothetical protein BAY61_22310 [Prauserella marina]|uniref:Uncharacterized protein n=1 Tax=Prauserella marina TaxID=530584 RepID=A0A222VTL7_9PSEU|nr:hypothetical protein [Prauserella marina]ASR37276.1 hypothetical protein BAY61_22310 [Prauserella marina]PWV72612.1 hypothetical protein DES30_110212 [Prauserella marina]SDD76023.1 hypothetical protein SAMN05421630_11226 [Prauserella marina]
MTYPPQPGQPQFGQQPGWQQGQGGGFPQQGGGYQQGGQFPQGGGYPQQNPYGQGQGGGFPPQEPKKKTGLWIGLATAVVVIAAFGVTAFLAPGFLLSDDDDNQAGGNGGTTTSETQAPPPSDEPSETPAMPGTPSDTPEVPAGQAGGAQELANSVAQGFQSQDETALNQLACTGSEDKIGSFTKDVNMVTKYELSGDVQESGSTATATADVTLENGGQTASGVVTMTFANDGGSWCWDDMEANPS